VQALTPESLKKAAEKYFDMENMIQVTLLPERP
jgi:predicted Zn-dependent peptidase